MATPHTAIHQSFEQPQPQQPDPQRRRIESLVALTHEMHNYDPIMYTPVDLEILMSDFCTIANSIASSKNSSTAQGVSIRDVLTYLQQQHYTMDAILSILEQPHENPAIHKWSLTALVWFVCTCSERATRAVNMGALSAIVRVMRRHRHGQSISAKHQRCSSHNGHQGKEDTLFCTAMSALVQLLGHADPAVLRRSIQFRLEKELKRRGRKVSLSRTAPTFDFDAGMQVEHDKDNDDESVSTASSSSSSASFSSSHWYDDDDDDDDGDSMCAESTDNFEGGSPLFLLEDIVLTMEMFPSSITIYREGCALFGSIYMLLANTQLTPSTSTPCASSNGPAQNVLLLHSPDTWCALKGRVVNRIYDDGLLDHRMSDQEARKISHSLLRLLVGDAVAQTMMRVADNQVCFGAAA